MAKHFSNLFGQVLLFANKRPCTKLGIKIELHQYVGIEKVLL